MGLSIVALQPLQYLGEYLPEDLENRIEQEPETAPFRIWTPADLSPIQYLTQFKQGWWKAFRPGQYRYESSCTSFNDMRRAISLAIYGIQWEEVCEKIANGDIVDGPFAEMLYFSDSEGSFDYLIARKIYDDTEEYYTKVTQTLNKQQFRNWCVYRRILEEVMIYKGIAYHY